MKKQKFNLKNVAALIACFAVSIMLALTGCNKDDNNGGGGTIDPTLTGIKFEQNDVTIEVDNTTTLKLVAIPSDAQLPKCDFTSNHKEVATVSSAGKVPAKAKGETTITAKTPDGKFSATCIVKVTGGGGSSEVQKLIKCPWMRTFIYNYFGTYKGYDIYNFYDDGIFVNDYWGRSTAKYIGKYSVSDGKLYLTEIKSYYPPDAVFEGRDGDMKTYEYARMKMVNIFFSIVYLGSRPGSFLKKNNEIRVRIWRGNSSATKGALINKGFEYGYYKH
jgi:hypothetical protein